ncbi:MAG: sulfite exporter TauE/SafE family protein [Ardenticatenaceae bacterium]|nr:sulfite exporter TauE/SafE family protein [Ardenticatenaceae bacterium]HBY97076.1 sulfite exporter TauE/SafE family protein [Chloroflexota bacterium]
MQHVTNASAGPRFQPARRLRVAIPATLLALIGLIYLLREQIPTAEWYAFLSLPASYLTGPIGDFADAINIPLLSVLLFGLIGATAPCQLTTNASALAYVARSAGHRQAVAGRALAYVLGKVLVYTVAGVVVILAGQELAQQSIPIIVAVRKGLGPLMILLGLYLLGLLPLRFSVGHGLASWIETRAGPGAGGAFLLGVAFSLAFCPTLFLLFFGLTIPMALRSPMGVVYPAVFALGTTLPLLGLAGLLSSGVGATRGYLARARRIDAWLRPAAAVVLILAGLNDIVTYWFL